MKTEISVDGLKCDFCGATTEGVITASHEGWSWFTGHRSNTFHACRACFNGRRREFDELLEASRLAR